MRHQMTRTGKVLAILMWSFVILVVIAIPAFIVDWYLTFYVFDVQKEKIIDQKFHQEVAKIPQLKIISFKLWEGDSIVRATIENKGTVDFWYGENGVPRISRISSFSTSFNCFFVNKGQKTKYVFTVDLVLTKESNFKKWFPFEVNNLKDMVERYDSIISVLSTFPKKPEMVVFEDRSGPREVVKQSNPEYLLKQEFRGKETWCDLFQ